MMHTELRSSGARLLPVACALVLAACAGDPGQERLEGSDAPPPAAAVSPQETESLDSQLQRLRVELAAGMEGDPERLLQAEAITDGLMEARRPFDWLATGYDVEARLRQLQAMADRVVAQLRRGAELATVAEDVADITTALTDLRAQLAAGRGGPAPPGLDSLLARDPVEVARRARAEARAAAGGGAAGGGASPAPAPAGAPADAETPETPPDPETPSPPPPDAGPLGRPVGP